MSEVLYRSPSKKLYLHTRQNVSRFSPSLDIFVLYGGNPGRFGPESFRPGRFGLGRFGLNLDVGRFGLFWWVVSALGRFGP